MGAVVADVKWWKAVEAVIGCKLPCRMEGGCREIT